RCARLSVVAGQQHGTQHRNRGERQDDQDKRQHPAPATLTGRPELGAQPGRNQLWRSDSRARLTTPGWPARREGLGGGLDGRADDRGFLGVETRGGEASFTGLTLRYRRLLLLAGRADHLGRRIGPAAGLGGLFV